MLISLYRCDGCWRITDNFQTSDGTWVRCGCGSKIMWTTNPTKFNLLKWILSNPKYIFKLIIQDWKESHNG